MTDAALPSLTKSARGIGVRQVRLACGLILDTVTRGRIEAKRLAYLAIPATRGTLPRAAKRRDGGAAQPLRSEAAGNGD